MQRLAVAVLLCALLAVTACGIDEPAAPAVGAPAWAQVTPAQTAEATKHGVPVAFENDLGMRFVLIPAGTFVMGSPLTERDPEDDETLDERQHEVTLTRAFYAQITEVTVAQYRVIDPDPGTDLGNDVPANERAVSSVSWHDATAFADALSRRQDGRSYRLPTEAEWEYACRAGTRTTFAFGDTLTREQADFDRFRTPGALTSPSRVARYRPNAWGLFDMHGNVSEWCRDWYGDYARGAVVDPAGPSEKAAVVLPLNANPDAGRREGKMRVVRGGYWDARAYWLRSAHRSAADPEGIYGGIGFRLVSPLPEK